jgi:transcriptional regulator with XRE-family HTH domain
MSEGQDVARGVQETNLSALLRLYRLTRRQGVRDLAPRIGLSIATLSRIERGHAMDATTLIKVLNWLVSAEDRNG